MQNTATNNSDYHQIQFRGYHFNINKRVLDYVGKLSLAGIIGKAVSKTYQSYNIRVGIKSIFEYSVFTLIPSLPRRSVEIGSIMFLNYAFLEPLKDYLDSLSNTKINIKLFEAYTTYTSLCYYYGATLMDCLAKVFPKAITAILSKTVRFTEISSLILIGIYLIELAKIKSDSNDQFKAIIASSVIGFGTLMSYYYMHMDSQYAIINITCAFLATLLTITGIGLQVFSGLFGKVLFGEPDIEISFKNCFDRFFTFFASLPFFVIPIIASSLVYLVT